MRQVSLPVASVDGCPVGAGHHWAARLGRGAAAADRAAHAPSYGQLKAAALEYQQLAVLS